ncbi:MAG: hypothetical protein AAGE80_11250 [Pseudomonadota bacterium]
MRWALPLLLAAAQASGQSLPDCNIEPSERARATCLDLEGEIRIELMQIRIETLIGGIQGSTPDAQRLFEQAILADQDAWRAETEARCDGLDQRLDSALCLIDAVAAREVQLDEALEPLEAQTEGVPFVTNGVEVFVPLDGEPPEPFLTLEDILTPR